MKSIKALKEIISKQITIIRDFESNLTNFERYIPEASITVEAYELAEKLYKKYEVENFEEFVKDIEEALR